MPDGKGMVMRAVGMVLRAQLRQHGKSWLALAVLAALVGGLAMAATVTARATAAAFPGFAARYGYDAVVYTARPLPQLAKMPQVTQVTPVRAPWVAAVGCASCDAINASGWLDAFELTPRDLARTVKLVAGRMPDQSDPGEALASASFADDSGVRVGSVIQIFELTRAQISQAEAKHGPPSPAQLAKVPRHSVRVTGLVITENEFPAGNGARYDLFPTRAYATAHDAHTQVLTFYDVKLRHGAADQAAFDSQLRPLGSLGADDLDNDAAAMQRAIKPQAVGWWVLAGLIALAGLVVLGQAAARQFSTDVDDHDALSALGLRGRQFVLLGLARAFIIGVAGAAGAVALAAALSPLTPVGEARLATADPGAVSVDPLVTLIGVPAVVAAVLAAVGLARSPARPPGPARSAAADGRPGPVHGPRGGRGRRAAQRAHRRPVRARTWPGPPLGPGGSALLGTVLAVTALSATAVFGASLTWLIKTPALYGVPFDMNFSNEGTGSGAVRPARCCTACSGTRPSTGSPWPRWRRSTSTGGTCARSRSARSAARP